MTSPTEPDEPVEPTDPTDPSDAEPQETPSPAAPRAGGAAEEADDVAGVVEDPATAPTDADPVDQAGSDELVLAQTELAERTLDLQRLQAEFLNYKRRVDRDRELVKQNATFGALTSLLPVLDDIDRAREHGEVEGGFKSVADALDRVVTSLGLTKFGARGDAFDPNLHEALMHGHSTEVTSSTVDVVANAGYRIGDRVVRAAKVTVLDPEA